MSEVSHELWCAATINALDVDNGLPYKKWPCLIYDRGEWRAIEFVLSLKIVCFTVWARGGFLSLSRALSPPIDYTANKTRSEESLIATPSVFSTRSHTT